MVIPFPERGGAGFRFHGKIGDADFDRLHLFNLAKGLREREALGEVEDGLTRTPELALCIAILKALTPAQRRRVSSICNDLSVAFPKDLASQQASFVATSVTLAGGDG